MTTLKRAILVLLALVGVAWGITIPQHVGLVNDFAGLLTPAQRASLETELEQFRQRGDAVLVVATVTSLEGLTVERYSLALANAWGVGDATKNNGIVLLVAPNERKVRIEIGKGLVDEIFTRGEGESVMQREILPQLRGNKWHEGIQQGARAIMASVTDAVAAAPTPEQRAELKRERELVIVWAFGILLVVGTGAFAINRILRRMNRKHVVIAHASRRADVVREYGKVKDRLEKLDRKHPKEVLSAIQDTLDGANLEALWDTLQRLETETGKWFQNDGVIRDLSTLVYGQLRKAESSVDSASGQLASLDRAEAECRDAMSGVPSLVESAQKAVQHPDVRQTTALLAMQAQTAAEYATRLMSPPEGTLVNWMQARSKAKEAFKLASQAVAGADADIRKTAEAREKMPKLLETLNERIEKLTQNLGKLNGVRRKKYDEALSAYQDARRLTEGGPGVSDILGAYLLLQTVDTNVARAESTSSFDFSSSSSSNYGSGGSSGGFGGGGFDGGGVSGSF